MSTHDTRPGGHVAGNDAIDIDDFVYAATGARVRKLMMPDGTHWFPAADVATELGYANTRQALLWHVPKSRIERLGELARSVYGADASSKIAGHGLKKSMNMVNLQGLILLVNACTKPESEPFKNWVAEMIVTIQRDGSYALEKARVQPDPGSPVAYAMPSQVADAIVRLEERNLRMDEECAELRRQEVRLFDRIADSLDRIADKLGAGNQPAFERVTLTADELLADWKERQLVVTGDIWAVAAYLAPALVNSSVASYPLRVIAQRTGLTEHRVHDSLRMLLKRGCIRQVGVGTDGAPRYTLHR
ncbi:Bro-N domain-containing protein [Streptomyces rimosus]|uniref:BRO-N domain-containing protein n=1 Tax=Streptomyces rimosus TaxID=1927 RepID=UPI0004C5DE1F|nr:Bro-N domain-containing protein [Streptomyces rimosus]